MSKIPLVKVAGTAWSNTVRLLDYIVIWDYKSLHKQKCMQAIDAPQA